MTLNYCYVFYQVALTMNITQAARRMNISQPSISRAISLLEDELGKKLFIRSKSGVKFTDDGKIFFEYISKGMNWFQKGEEEISKPEQMEKSLTLGVSQLTIRTILPPILQKFTMTHPEVNLVIQTDSSISTIEHLMDELVDVAIVPDPIDFNPELETIKVAAMHSSLVGGLKYSFLKDRKLKFSALANYPFIALSRGTAGRRWLDRICIASSAEIIPAIEVPSSDLIVPLAKHNLGLGIVADNFTEEDIRNGNLIQLDLDELLPDRNFLLCYKQRRFPDTLLQQFIDLFNDKASETW